MRLILDTHILLWWWDDSPKLSKDLRDLIADSDHEVFVSAVSIAEIAVKKSIGRLVVNDDFAEGIERDGFTELPLTAAHGGKLASLPLLGHMQEVALDGAGVGVPFERFFGGER